MRMLLQMHLQEIPEKNWWIFHDISQKSRTLAEISVNSAPFIFFANGQRCVGLILRAELMPVMEEVIWGKLRRGEEVQHRRRQIEVQRMLLALLFDIHGVAWRPRKWFKAFDPQAVHLS